ncbi:hypothetical protein RHMOL_Rhmol07G0207900 [Rhododendron molle]|uniref:Uncharacterized protein n=1 Tax=Rhododendron molle TaxID=49168 RepID=A0ACC0N4T6_RHOML|nr:hypothetical protein RHMOL_Rhmol07G0207900 [Rhododendron molle]
MGNLKVLVRLSFGIDWPKEDRFIFLQQKKYRSFYCYLHKRHPRFKRKWVASPM